jgi:glucose/arabinose dehydrogenase
VISVEQPYTNHNAGQLQFGPDGFLYVGLGDGGSGGDPEENGQDATTLLGSVLRLDVNVDG